MALSKPSQGDKDVDLLVPLENWSAELRILMDKGTLVTQNSGYEKFVELLNSGQFAEGHKVKPGYIIVMLRSFRHAIADSGVGKIKKAGITIAPDVMMQGKVAERLEKKGQQQRPFAYPHTAVYVGCLNNSKGEKVHIVIENAGGDGEVEKPQLRCTDIKTSFDDLLYDKSPFKIIQPSKRHATAQKAMAAFHGEFKYKYLLYGFNCECFTTACAGLYDPTRDGGQGKEAANVGRDSDDEDGGRGAGATATTKKLTKPVLPDQFRRVLGDLSDPKKVSKEAEERANENREHYLSLLEKLFLDNHDMIDGGKYQLYWVKEDKEPGVTIKG